MLKLSSETDARWAAWAVEYLPEVLLDHAHCEKKAAGAAVNLLFRYPREPALQVPLANLAREELEHFEAVLGELSRLDIPFDWQRPGPYGGKLHAIVRAEEPERLLDTLLCCAVIEARSCERLKLLAGVLEDTRLRALYEALLASEARHHGVYVELARTVCPEHSAFEARLREICDHESRIIASAPALPRLHAGEGFVSEVVRP